MRIMSVIFPKKEGKVTGDSLSFEREPIAEGSEPPIEFLFRWSVSLREKG
jgi:hypothetical protein